MLVPCFVKTSQLIYLHVLAIGQDSEEQGLILQVCVLILPFEFHK